MFLLHPCRKQFFNKRAEFFSPLYDETNFHFIVQSMWDVGRDLVILWTTAFPPRSPRTFLFFLVWHGFLRLGDLIDCSLPAFALKNGIKFAGRFCL